MLSFTLRSGSRMGTAVSLVTLTADRDTRRNKQRPVNRLNYFKRRNRIRIARQHVTAVNSVCDRSSPAFASLCRIFARASWEFRRPRQRPSRYMNPWERARRGASSPSGRSQLFLVSFSINECRPIRSDRLPTDLVAFLF